MDETDKCVICLEPLRGDEELYTALCGHTFHKECHPENNLEKT